MISSARFWSLGFAIVSLSVVGCLGKVSVNETDPDPDPGCAEPVPPVPSGSWCPPVYECVNGKWVDTAGACPEPECPAEKPSHGSDCPMLGQECLYEEWVPCGELEEVPVVCTDEGWSVTAAWCSPAPVCPDELPVMGTDCTDWPDAFGCEHKLETACGTEYVWYYCQFSAEGAIWVPSSTSSCEVCKDHGTEAECGFAPGCQWLTPGCGEEPVQTGCYPKEGCDVSGCNDDSICAEVTYDPCYGLDCNACGASYFACLPGWSP